jgi:hypothetical protein
MMNLSPLWVKARMTTVEKWEGKRHSWYDLAMLKRDLRTAFRHYLVNKKRARWDMSRGAYVYRKGDQEVIL